jgi:hypothetical protein
MTSIDANHLIAVINGFATSNVGLILTLGLLGKVSLSLDPQKLPNPQDVLYNGKELHHHLRFPCV